MNRRTHHPGSVVRRLMGLLALGLLVVPLAGQGAGPGDPPTPQTSAPAPVDPAGRSAVIIHLHGMVNDVMHDRLKRQLAEAEAAGASEIVLEMDTWGGMAISALEMSDTIKNTATPITAWVNPKAISAGAMISVAADRIVVAERARIGDCMPISGSGQSIAAAEREKIETVVREEFRDSARRHGYSVTLCTAMVTRSNAVYAIQHVTDGTTRYVFADALRDYGLTAPAGDDKPDEPDEPAPAKPNDAPNPIGDAAKRAAEALRDMGGPAPDPGEQADEPADPPAAVANAAGDGEPYDPGRWRITKRVLDAGQLLTMSQHEAIDYGFAVQLVRNDAELAAFLNVPPGSITRVEANWSEQLVTFLTHPAVRGLLTIVLLMGLYSEMQSPGLGLAGGVALVAGLILLGAPYLTGLANSIEILVILLGVALLAVEIFVIPGFGITGIAGLALMMVGLLLTFVPSEPGPGWVPQLPGTWQAIQQGMITLTASLTIALIGMAVLTKYFGRLPLLNKLVLSDSQQANVAGPTVSAGVGGTGVLPLEVSPGDTGTAVGDLRPGGEASIGSHVLDVTTQGEWIGRGTNVRVVEVTGARVVVEKA